MTRTDGRLGGANPVTVLTAFYLFRSRISLQIYSGGAHLAGRGIGRTWSISDGVLRWLGGMSPATRARKNGSSTNHWVGRRK